MAAAAPATVPANRTRFNPVVGGLASLGPMDEDLWPTSRDNPMVASLPFLEWFKPAAPADFALPAFQVQGVLLAAITYNGDDRAAFAAEDIMGSELDRVRCSAISHAMANANIFATVYADKHAFAKSVAESTILDRAAIALRGANIARTEAFSTPAAGPGPPALGFLCKVSWWAVLQEGSRADAAHPCELASQLVLLLGSRSRRNARADEGSTIRISAELFKSYVRLIDWPCC